jgi:pimeloyl-ACP methyl ester carboxylesterase
MDAEAARLSTVAGASGNPLHVCETGPRDGPPVIALHGLCGTRDQVLKGDLVERNGLRLIAYDARGHGRSGPAPGRSEYRYRDLAADLTAVMRALDAAPALLVGVSIGALTALRLALDEPDSVSALALVTPAFDPDAPAGAHLERADLFAHALRTADAEAFERADPIPSADPAVARAMRSFLRDRLTGHDDLGAVADAVQVLMRDRAFDRFGELAAVRCPVLVVGSRDDLDPLHPLKVACAYRRALPGSTWACEEPGRLPIAWRGRRLAQLVLKLAQPAPSTPARAPAA